MFCSITQDTVCPKLGRIGGVEVRVHSLFIISTLNGVNRASCPSRFTSGEGYPTLIEWVAGWDAESVSTLAEIELGFGILLPPYTAD